MLEHVLMKSWYQRSTLSTGSHITPAEIRDHRQLGYFGNNIWITNLQGKAMFRPVADGLAM